MQQNNIDLQALLEESERRAAEAKTPVYLAIDGRAAAVITIADPIKSDSKDAIARIKQAGLESGVIDR